MDQPRLKQLYKLNGLQSLVLLYNLRQSEDVENDPHYTPEELYSKTQDMSAMFSKLALENILTQVNLVSKDWMEYTPQYKKIHKETLKYFNKISPYVQQLLQHRWLKRRSNTVDQVDLNRRLEHNAPKFYKDVLESCLYNANLLDESNKFWHPNGKSFEQFVSEILGPNEAFNRYYNYIYKKEADHGK